LELKETRIARVVGQHKQRLELMTEQGARSGRLKTAAFFRDADQDFPTVGDWVEIHEEGGMCQILKVLPRKSVFYRYNGATERSGKQAVAANMDYIWILTSCNQEMNLRRLERYIAQAQASGARPVIVLTKSDLTEEAERLREQVTEICAGIHVHVVSSHTGAGLEQLRCYMTEGSSIALLGSSGVGKSSLVNALLGEARMKTSEIREKDDRGRHTTTHRQLLMAENGAALMDTPGMRTVTLWDSEASVEELFSSLEELEQQCRYRSCTHQQEPGCAVRQAIEEGWLSAARWQAYQDLKKESARTKRMEQRVANKNFRKIQKANHKRRQKGERAQNKNILDWNE
jgi:ribosome biogenesis GTPase